MAIKMDTNEFEELLVSSKVLETLYGVKDRTIRDLADKGILKRDSHGKYLFWKSTQSYITALRIANASKADTKLDDDNGILDLDEEKAKHERLKRQITAIKLQLIQGQVHKAEDVEAVMTDMFARFKSKVTALPAKLAKRLEGKTRVEIQNILKADIASVLVELASYNPADFYSDDHIEIAKEDIESIGVSEYEE